MEEFNTRYGMLERIVGRGESADVYTTTIPGVVVKVGDAKTLLVEACTMASLPPLQHVMGMLGFAINRSSRQWLIAYPKMDGDLSGVSIAHEDIPSVFLEVCLGIAELHALNVAHRDIRLANILHKGERIYVSDLGGAKNNACTSEGNTIALANDVFLLGRTLTEMYLKDGPFLPAIRPRLDGGKGMVPYLERAGAPQKAIDLILSMLRIDSANRYTIWDVLKSPYFAGIPHVIPKQMTCLGRMKDRDVSSPRSRPIEDRTDTMRWMSDVGTTFDISLPHFVRSVVVFDAYASGHAVSRGKLYASVCLFITAAFENHTSSAGASGYVRASKNEFTVDEFHDAIADVVLAVAARVTRPTPYDFLVAKGMEPVDGDELTEFMISFPTLGMTAERIADAFISLTHAAQR